MTRGGGERAGATAEDVTRKLAVVVGDVINDVVVRPLAPPAAGTDTPAHVVLTPGGSGANQAAWMGALGARVRFVGRAGASDAAEHREVLERLGVEAGIISDATLPTGTIVVFVSPDGVRSMFTDRGANAALCAANLPGELLEGAGLLHISGYSLFSNGSREPVLGLWERAVAMGIDTSTDPCSVSGLEEAGADAFLAWTSGASLVFPNLEEGRFLTGAEAPDDIVTTLLEHYGAVALKLGADGVLVGERSGERLRLEAPPVELVDPTGAGDAFCAGFLAAWLEGARFATAATAGISAAGRAVTRVGGRPPATP